MLVKKFQDVQEFPAVQFYPATRKKFAKHWQKVVTSIFALIIGLVGGEAAKASLQSVTAPAGPLWLG